MALGRRRFRSVRRRFRRRRRPRFARRRIRFGRRRFAYRRRRNFRRKNGILGKLLKSLVTKVPIYDVVRGSSYSKLGVNGWLMLPVLGDLNRHFNICRQLPNPFANEYPNQADSSNLGQNKWEMRNAYVTKDTFNYKLYNPNPGCAYFTAYYCQLRRDCSPNYFPLDNTSGTLPSKIATIWTEDMKTTRNLVNGNSSMGVGESAVDYPAADAGIAAYYDRLDFTPFMSSTFCQWIKITKKIKGSIKAGEVKTLQLKNRKKQKIDLQYIKQMDATNTSGTYTTPAYGAEVGLDGSDIRYQRGFTRFILIKYHGDYVTPAGAESTWSTPNGNLCAAPVQLAWLGNRKTVYQATPSLRNNLMFLSGNKWKQSDNQYGGYYHAGGSTAANLNIVRPGRIPIQVTREATDYVHTGNRGDAAT